MDQLLASRFDTAREFLVNWVDRDATENEWVEESRLRDSDDLDSSKKVDEFLAVHQTSQGSGRPIPEEVEDAVGGICDIVARESLGEDSSRSGTSQCGTDSVSDESQTEQDLVTGDSVAEGDEKEARIQGRQEGCMLTPIENAFVTPKGGTESNARLVGRNDEGQDQNKNLASVDTAVPATHVCTKTGHHATAALDVKPMEHSPPVSEEQEVERLQTATKVEARKMCNADSDLASSARSRVASVSVHSN